MESLTQILNPFKGENIVEWFMDLVTLWHQTGAIEPEDKNSPKGIFQWGHYNNFTLWHFEDDARRRNVEDSLIVDCKRQIDKHNQQRNDAIEKIDLWLDTVLTTADIVPTGNVPINSETVGSIIDRMSIMSLKIYHMDEQINRSDVDADHITLAKNRKAVLDEQLVDLAVALDLLVLDLRMARRRHKIYRQYKMYNDPKWNPAVYKND